MLRRLGDRLFLVGVAHVLPESAKEVRDIILREKPEIVAVELCPIRYLMLTRKVGRPGLLQILRAGKLRLTLLSGVLHLLQSKFAHKTGMPVGEEMLVAIRLAEEAGARVELIDRDLSVTLQRLMDRMPLKERIRVFIELLLGFFPLGKRVEIERLTKDEIVAYLLRELKRTSPTSYEVLIEERDAYMASRIANLLLTGKKIACIVGAGHLPGIYQRLSETSKGMKMGHKIGGSHQAEIP